MAKRGASTRLWKRSIAIMLLIIFVGFGLAIGRLFYLQTYLSEELQQRAVGQQLKSTALSAKRGSIYDRNGNILAQSITVWKIVLEPAHIQTEEARKYIASGLSQILSVDEKTVLEKTYGNNYYSVIKTGVDTDVKDRILEFKEELSKKFNLGNCIDTIEEYKRYYTNDNFLADVLGFVGADDQGLSGIEYQYDKYLTGTAGKLVFAKNAAGNEMPFDY